VEGLQDRCSTARQACSRRAACFRTGYVDAVSSRDDETDNSRDPICQMLFRRRLLISQTD
jgi:hypothetical protein